jgi:hypothetical protein
MMAAWGSSPCEAAALDLSSSRVAYKLGGLVPPILAVRGAASLHAEIAASGRIDFRRRNPMTRIHLRTRRRGCSGAHSTCGLGTQ